MSYQQLFADLVTRLEQESYAKTIKDGDGKMVDTGLRRFVQNLISALKSAKPISIDGPLALNNAGEGPAIIIVNTGNSHQVVEGFNSNGEYVSLGVGVGSEGIVASELIPLPNYSIDTTVAHDKYTNGGRRGGVSQFSPGTSYGSPGGHPGPGFGPANPSAKGVGSGYGTETSGDGFPYVIRGGNDTFFAFRPFNEQFYREGGNLGGAAAKRVTITAIGDDTLTCTFPGGSSETVARPFRFRKSDYDGETIGGITYTYAGGVNQVRTADNGSVSETQTIVPLYAVDDELIVIDVTESGVSGVKWIDANVDGKVWAKQPTSCP